MGDKTGMPVPTVKMIKRLVAAGEKLNMPVFLHGNTQASQEFAVKAGVNVLAHGMWHMNSSASENEQKVDEILAGIAQASMAYQPTIRVLIGEREIFNPDFFKDPLLKQVVPEKLLNWYKSKAGQWFKLQMSGSFSLNTEDPKENYQRASQLQSDKLAQLSYAVSRLNEIGGYFVFGSDTPSGPIYTQFPGYNGFLEMKEWENAGISLETILRAATIRNARLLGLEDRIGSVEEGKEADLLLLAKNPLETVAAYNSITWVILDGKAFPRSNFSAENISREGVLH